MEEQALKFNLHNEATSFTLIRHIFKTQLESEDAYFECSIKEDDHNYSEFELPITNMKIKFTSEENIDDIFSLMINHYLNKPYDVTKIDIIIDKSKDGLFDISNNQLSSDVLTQEFNEIITNTTSNINEQQFLISHIVQPDRLFIRLMQKNIKKSNIIKNELKKNYPWLLDENKINFIIKKFLDNIQKILSPKLIELINKTLLYKKNNNNKKKTKKEINKISELKREMDELNTEIARLFYKIDDKGKYIKTINIGRLSNTFKNENEYFNIGFGINNLFENFKGINYKQNDNELSKGILMLMKTYQPKKKDDEQEKNQGNEIYGLYNTYLNIITKDVVKKPTIPTLIINDLSKKYKNQYDADFTKKFYLFLMVKEKEEKLDVEKLEQYLKEFNNNQL